MVDIVFVGDVHVFIIRLQPCDQRIDSKLEYHIRSKVKSIFGLEKFLVKSGKFWALFCHNTYLGLFDVIAFDIRLCRRGSKRMRQRLRSTDELTRKTMNLYLSFRGFRYGTRLPSAR